MENTSSFGSKEAVAFALLKEILVDKNIDSKDLNSLPFKKRGDYILQVYKQCLNVTQEKNTAPSMPDIPKSE